MSLLKKLDKKKLSNNQINIAQNYSENLPKLSFNTHYGVKFLELYSIVYANAAGSYTEIHTIDGKVTTVTKSLKEFEELTSAHQFFRCHKTYVVNLAYVSELIKNNEYLIVMKNNVRIPLSIRKRDEFQSRFK
ncbi:MAG: LytTR family DNA-binding domain-containing protein [Bacteroidales bacterium]|nr:LytTR family DNA-binding domain-containing protein [Bacteroidales bacterium]MDD4640459.1 LytTR family DNA-binding domain-containing protein [Bacteroidales bacterium]